ncbi:MAG: peptidylprolyl isomerase [Rhodospirillaceae bacterium]
MNAVSVNGVAIPERDIASEAQNHPAASPEEARHEATLALVVRQLLLQRAGALGLDPEPSILEDGRRETDDDALIRQLLHREVTTPEPDRESCERYFRNNRQKFRSPDLVEARHILFAADPEDPSRRQQAETEAKATLRELGAEPGRFGELARTRSACPSAKQDGSLGQLAPGQTVPEFDTFLFNLEEGQLCPVPVKTRFGFHVVRVDRKLPGRDLPFEAVQDRIAGYLKTASWSRAVAQYLGLLAASARIDGFEVRGWDTPLVQ